MAKVLKLYKAPALHSGKLKQVTQLVDSVATGSSTVDTEFCFYVEIQEDLSPAQLEKLKWILSHGFQDPVKENSIFISTSSSLLIEIGPRLNFSTPFSSNAVSIFQSVGLTPVTRVERAVRYLITPASVQDLGTLALPRCLLDSPTTTLDMSPWCVQLVGQLHDRMTECEYTQPITTFHLPIQPQPWEYVPIVEEGRPALERVSQELGLSFDDWDLDYYTKLFGQTLARNPTTVECFDLAQSNSEHSRHWFFKGRMVVDGEEAPDSLIDLVISTQRSSNPNNVIKFSDNSSAIQGFQVSRLVPHSPGTSGPFTTRSHQQHIIFTAETHNFPTGVAPFSGATTGTGGRIRDVQAAGRGAHVVAGTAAYSFGNLNIPGHITSNDRIQEFLSVSFVAIEKFLGRINPLPFMVFSYDLPWEDKDAEYPSNFASPLNIAVEASNGASDYGNKFGEPIISGFARSFGMVLPDGTRREYIKPIMFTGGIGHLNSGMEAKDAPETGMLVVKLGGPVFRIGVGGGAASSVQVQGDQKEELDFGAVQRGDAEMEQKLNRVIRACIEMGAENIIRSIHDQGAGGNGNVLKEIADPAGAEIYLSGFQLGDPTLSTLEVWGAEYQESNAILVRSQDKDLLQAVGVRERCPVCVVGKITGDGRIVLKSSPEDTSSRHPVDLELEHVLGSMPRKVFKLDKQAPVLRPLKLPTGLALQQALDRVLRLPSVASKRYLTNKVDRSVTGLIAQQQCVGPLHTPLADVAVTALSHFDTVGSATAIGEQPIKGLVDPEAGARMTVAESLTNLVFAPVTSLQDVKCSGNWMWAAKLPGEGQALYAACRAMSTLMSQLGVAVDGGKDSLSMAARVGGDTIKAPGTLVVSTYVGCPDITRTVTPDLKVPRGKGALIYVDLSNGKGRLGGSALAQVYKQLGDEVADIEDPLLLRKAFSWHPQLQNLFWLDVKCSGNWMWAAKLPGEGQALYAACRAMSTLMSQLGVAVDGGKDSLSCPDITRTVTPDLKVPRGKGALIYVDLSNGKGRLGGSALAQVYKQLGDEVADIEDPLLLRKAFCAIQDLINDGKVLAGHDISDGGLITCLLEMAFAGNCGLQVQLPPGLGLMEQLFGEEAGWVLEVAPADLPGVLDKLKDLPCQHIGYSLGFGPASEVVVRVGDQEVLRDSMTALRDIWEETSFRLDMLQANPECVEQEQSGLSNRTAPPFKVNFEDQPGPQPPLSGNYWLIGDLLLPSNLSLSIVTY
ncbi:PFAS [Cordylochernes scorpioides]|uniref:PFAS n=1 Tax=Cordylochernes scorpioides TaxID=51811 RepID=A0ABY6JW72_9ARAC|nr:PFAS [Cordylochernes scorpioides]